MPNEAFVYELLDNTDAVLKRLDGITAGGSLDFSIHATIRGSGSVPYFGDAIDWLRHRVRVSMIQDEAVTALITGIVRVPDESYTSAGYGAQLDLYDKTAILADDNFGAAYSVPAGAVVTDAVEAVIASAGIVGTAIEASPATLADGMMWEANTPKLTICNDLLDAAHYYALQATGHGYLRSEPVVDPDQRPIKYRFNDDGSGLYLPAFSRSYDLFSAPNRYIVIGTTDGETEAPSAVAEIDDGRGYWTTRTETDVANTGNLAEIAQSKLTSARQVTETFEITHPRFNFGLNDAVLFTHKELGTRRAVVQKQTHTLSAGGLVTSTLRVLV